MLAMNAYQPLGTCYPQIKAQ